MRFEQGFNTKAIQALVSILGLVILLIWMQGGFTSKTPPGTAQASERKEPIDGPAVKVELKEIHEIMRWPGTVTAHSVAQVATKISARVLAIHVKTGDLVKAGQIVAQLDPSELQSRVNQVRSALSAAEAEEVKAYAEFRRTQSLYEQEAATKQTLEAAQAAARTSGAQVAEARANIAAAESLLAETVLRAPFDGSVVKRNLEPGDMAMPGAAVLTIQSGQRLRVEASIPETCASTLKMGENLKGYIGTQEHMAKVEEIAPATDTKTRTVLIKAGLENQTVAQPGAFVWLEQVCGSHKSLLIPVSAVSRSGQLESVRLVVEDSSRLRHIRTGNTHDGWVEVLSGLREGDRILVGGGK